MFHWVRAKLAKPGVWLSLILLAAVPTAGAYDYRYFTSDGVNLAYADLGFGTPVILLHGFESDFEEGFKPAAELLSHHFRVIGLDLRGHGRSGKPHDEAVYGKHLATDVLNLMDGLHIQRAHVVGHSMGGIVALYLVANHPERFSSGVTIGNGLFKQELTAIGWLFRGMFAWSDFKQYVGLSASQPGRDGEALLDVAKSLNELTVSEQQAAAIRVPLMAIRGGPKDDPHDTVERLVKVNPSVKMLRIEAEDHASILSSAAFLQGLNTFLQQQPAAESATLRRDPIHRSTQGG